MTKAGLKLFGATFAVAIALTTNPALSQTEQVADAPSLETQFVNPPNSARPRVWWHWLNGNITKDGITKDLDWMSRVGIGGLQNFDVDLNTPVLVKNRLVYMTPEWKDAFRFAAGEAERRGLELAIAASPGWSETGGPWVAPGDGLKKVVWSETPLVGGKRFTGKLAQLPGVTGAFQDMPFFDPLSAMAGDTAHKVQPQFGGQIAVFAVPVSAADLLQPVARDNSGKALDAAALTDASLATGIDLPKGSAETPTSVTLDYGKLVTVRSATLFVPGAAAMFFGATVSPQLEASLDGKSWTSLGVVPAMQVPTTVSFAPTSARLFRVTLRPAAPTGANMGNPAPGIVPPAFFAALAGAGSKTYRLAQFRLSSEAMIDRFEAKAGFELERDYYKLGMTDAAAPAIAPGRVVNLSDRVKPDGTLDWTPPKGMWKVIRLGYSLLGTTNHPAPAEATGLEVDKFDGDAVRAYLDHYVGMYRDAAGKDLFGGKGVRAILTDSIEVGAANWTPKMVDQFKRLRGYDPTPWLPALTGVAIGSREQSDKFLYDYRRTLADLMASEHYGTVAEVAHANGLKVYGEALEDHRPSLGDDMAMRRHTDVPMSALWTFPQGGKPNPSYLADMKGAASVAHVYGQNLVAAESMTSALSYWADSPRTLKHAIDLEFVTGVNRPVIHTSVHSPDEAGEPGLSLMIFGQYFNRHEGWADLAKPWVDYISRNGFMLQQGRNFADVAYFYGEEAPLTGLFGDKPVADAPRAYAYDFVNPGALLEALRNEGDELVSMGGARYKVLYLGGSSSHMTVPVLRRLAELVEGGATVVGNAPVASPSLADDPVQWSALVKKLWPGSDGAPVGKGRVIASSDVEAALAGIGVASDLRFTGGQDDTDLPFVHRRLSDGDTYFIVNRKDRAERVEAHFRVTGKVPELWHAETGQVETVSYRIENGETVVPLTLGGEESVHVVFRKPAAMNGLTVQRLDPRVLATVTAPWTVTFQPGRGAPASISLPTLAPLSEQSDSGVKHFAGLATYSTTFAAPKGWKPGQPLWLDLGEVREVAEVRVNGQSVGYAWHAPYRVDASHGVKPGRNVLEVRVGTLWVNRLIGDAQPGASKLTHTALDTYLPGAPLQESGLIGPVRLLGK
ncbi:MAG: glycoside hydrolase [Sphingomonadales bacterium]|nr:glycoside hydrolase [Sphingomonadales bacterium]